MTENSEFFAAIRSNDLDAVAVLRLLLENGANPNSKSSNGVTPLSTATRHKKQERVELLRQHGATA